MSRRLTSNQFMDMKSRMIPLNMPVIGVLSDPRREWKQLCYGGTRVAHSLDVDWKKFNLNDYIFTHCSIVSSVATEPNGYYIKPVCSPIVNANGNAWTNAVLLATFKSFIGGYNYCFQAGTEVLMSDGTYKKIEDVEIGDYVISHRGKKQKVLHTFAREYSGEMIETKINHYKNPIISTGNHPFRTVNASFDPSLHARKIKAKHSDRIQRSMVYDALSGRKHFLKNFQAKEQWTNAELLKRGSVLLGEDLPTGDNGINVGDISELLGYYLAGGCLSSKNKHSGVVFVFGKHEEYLARKVEKLSKNVFVGAKVTVTDKTKDFGVWRVQVNSPEASRVFHRLGGHLSHLKKMSEEVFSWDRKSQMNVLVSWLEGDGDFHTETGRIRGSTVSKSLGEQMLYLCRLNGIKASLVFSKARIGEQTSTVHLPRGGEIKDYPVISRHHGWHLHISSSSVEKVINSSTRWDGFVPQLRKNPDFNKWENKNVFLVSSATSFQSTQMVYNIEVEEDNSYLINPGIAVHNCEHIQIPSLSKGTILDAVLRPFIYKDKEGNPVEVYICDILVATSKNHWDLVQKILNGDLNTLSMGTVCRDVQCSKCGRIFHDDEDSCEHIQDELLTNFKDENGIIRIVAELCGSSHWDQRLQQWVGNPDSNKFIEASWVQNPAYVGAVINHFIQANMINGEIAGNFGKEPSLEDAIMMSMGMRVADSYGRLSLKLIRERHLELQRLNTINRVASSSRLLKF